ncbi:hypothetical protein [Massilia endophytica]|uniref:hypothetical protein n=1 Tax=Massilia endophytica TaxID=2899220 RepID=UPI001E3D6950|nr:hypothetical protein [Massilia endophytica]UGQ47977.1 hypothetical protein LSQ66_05790 [Massilia endophytica]
MNSRARLGGLVLAAACAAPGVPAAAGDTPARPAPGRLPARADHGPDGLRVAGALLLASAAAAGMVLGLKRAGLAGLRPGRSGPPARLRRLDRLRLGPHCTLHLVGWNETEILLVEHEHGVRRLAVRPAPPASGGEHGRA